MARFCSSVLLLLTPALGTEDMLAAIQTDLQARKPQANLTIHTMSPFAEMVGGMIQMAARRAGVYNTGPASVNVKPRTFALRWETTGREETGGMQLSLGDACKVTTERNGMCFLNTDSKLSKIRLTTSSADDFDASGRMKSEVWLTVFGMEVKLAMDCGVCGSQCEVKMPIVLANPPVMETGPCPYPKDYEQEWEVPADAISQIAGLIANVPEAKVVMKNEVLRPNGNTALRMQFTITMD